MKLELKVLEFSFDQAFYRFVLSLGNKEQRAGDCRLNHQDEFKVIFVIFIDSDPQNLISIYLE